MKIGTSYYAKIKDIPDNYILVSISGGLTKELEESVDIWDKRFAPNLSLFTEYKDSPEGSKREIQYVKRFKKEVLEIRDFDKILKSWTDKFGEDKTYVMLCYEGNNINESTFCHRRIVAEALEKKYNIEVPELFFDYNTYKIEDYKVKLKDEINEKEW